MKHTILTVMSDPIVRANLSYALHHAGFNVVESVDPRSVAEQIRRQFASLVIASLHEPKALELCRDIRQNSDVPVLVQLPVVDERSEWMCFQAGADDVVSTATSKRVLLARVAALLRGHEQPHFDEPRVLEVGALRIDLDARTLAVNEQDVVVTRTEFDLLAQLMAQPRRVHVRGDLVQAVWGEYHADHIIETHLSRLRKKIRAAGGPEIGEAVRGVGYRLGIDAYVEALVS